MTTPLLPEDAALRAALGRELDAWTPPTPRWAAAPARRLIAAQADAPARPVARLLRRLDLVGWLLNQPADRMPILNPADDPRVVLYNRLLVGALRYSGPQAVLLRHAMARI